MLHAFADSSTAHAEELALLESLDTGKPISDACAVDIPLAIKTDALLCRGARQDLRRGRAAEPDPPVLCGP